MQLDVFQTCNKNRQYLMDVQRSDFHCPNSTAQTSVTDETNEVVQYFDFKCPSPATNVEDFSDAEKQVIVKFHQGPLNCENSMNKSLYLKPHSSNMFISNGKCAANGMKTCCLDESTIVIKDYKDNQCKTLLSFNPISFY